MSVSSHAENPAVREQFESAGQQRTASSLGMWIFLVTEVMFFGGMFTAYTVYRNVYPNVFAHASRTLNAWIGAANTAVLLCSSFTMVLAVHAAQIGARRLLILFLILTMILGGVFLGIKAYEWHEKFAEHHVPGARFHMEGEPMQGQAQLFFSLYFAMTGMHALHMVIGLGILTVIAIQAYMGKFSPAYYSPVDVAGLYWHFVDIVWIFLFPLLYLIDRHK
ncbi:MAG: cytochrome c oxidase subunit 3 family protein [Bryobacteraceae bacterium]